MLTKDIKKHIKDGRDNGLHCFTIITCQFMYDVICDELRVNDVEIFETAPVVVDDELSYLIIEAYGKISNKKYTVKIYDFLPESK